LRRLLWLAMVLGVALPVFQGSAAVAATGIVTSIVLAGPKDGGGEPSMAIARDNTIYISYPGAHMDLVRSTDGGKTWTAGTSPESPSGDTSVNVDSSGAVYESNLNGIKANPNTLQVDIFKSFDKGMSWPIKGQSFLSSSNTSGQPFLVDRQWVDSVIPPGKTTAQARVSLEYHDWAPGLVWVSTSVDGGAHYGAPVNVVNSPLALADSYCNTIPGGLKIVPYGLNQRGIAYKHPGRTYAAWLAADAANAATGCNETQMAGFHSVWVAYSDDGGATWTDQLVYDAGPGHDGSEIFADLTLDDVGNPYVAFTMNILPEFDVWASASFDGATWMQPAKVNLDTGTHYFPAISAGRPGQIDVAWIATPDIVPATANGKPFPGADANSDWKVFVGQSLNFNSGQPTFTQSTVTPTVMHHGDVCTVGIFCSAVPGANRNLLDFIDVQVDRGGRAHVAFTGDFGSYDGIYSANQVSGPTVGAPGH
jgi:hypothetical protein